MNNTLTGLGLALVLALVAALVGPWFVNWNAYRDSFATQASALIGSPVKVAGAVDARLLPSPYIRFRDLSAGEDGRAQLAIAEVEIVLAIGPLLRGEFKAERVKLVAPRLSATVAADGSVETPFRARSRGALAADSISFDRAEIVDGAVTIDAPGGRTAIDRIAGVAEAGSLRGPYRFEGSFGRAAQRKAVRITTGRSDESGVVRVKLGAFEERRPETLELDGALSIGVRPRFDGQIALARPAPKADAKADQDEPWRIAGHLVAEPSRVTVEDIDASFGPDERAIRLSGRGALALGQAPTFELALATRQIDLDRIFGESRPATPAAFVERLGARFSKRLRSPIDGRLSLEIGGLVLAGDVARNLRTSLVADDGDWRIEAASAQLPGGTSVSAAGALAFANGAPGFAGHVDLATEDFSALRRWLGGGAEPGPAPVRKLAIGGDVTAHRGAVTIENAAVSADGANSSGRLAWRDAEGDDGRARIEAALTSDRLDLDAFGLDRITADALRGAAGTDVALALDAKTLVFGGVRMSEVAVDGVFDREGLDLRRLAIGDAGGAKISGAGRIAMGESGPEGAIGLDLEARGLSGLLALAKAAGANEDVLSAARDRAPAVTPLKLEIDVEAGPDGRTLSARGEAGGGSLNARLSANQLSLDAPVEIDIRYASPDGRRLAALAGLDVSPAVAAPGGEIALRLSGTPSRGMTGEGRFVGLGVELAARGGAAVAPEAGLSASADVTFASDNLVALGEALGRFVPGALPRTPASLTARVSLTQEQAIVQDLKGRLAGREVSGSATAPFDPQKPFQATLAFDELPLVGLAGLALSPDALAAGAVNRRSIWPASPFGASPVRGLSGRVDVAAQRVPLGADWIATGARFALALRPSTVAIENFAADLEGGRLTGGATVSRSNADATVSTSFALTGARIEKLLRMPAAAAPVIGAFDIRAEAQGTGRTLASIVSGLTGTGIATLKGGALRRLDVAAIDAVEPQIEAGLPLEAPRIAGALERGLGGADLAFDQAVAPFTISGGVIRSGAFVNESATARLGGGFTLDLGRLALDADLTLAPRRPDAPQIGVSFEGPLAAPRRRLDVTAFTGWLSVRAVERETKRIEAMEAEMREKARLARERAEEERRRLEEERRVAEEARIKAEAERRKREAEARALLDALPAPTPQPEPPRSAPLDITPPGAAQVRPDGLRGGPSRSESASPQPLPIFPQPLLIRPEAR